MARRGYYGPAAVGNVLYHTVGEREAVVRDLAAWVDGFWGELEHQLLIHAPGLVHPGQQGVIGTDQISLSYIDAIDPTQLDPKMLQVMNAALANDPGLRDRWNWYKIFARPQLMAWKVFRREQIGKDSTLTPGYVDLGTRFATDWSEYERWRDRLVSLWNAARGAGSGFHVTSPEPPPLPSTIWDSASELGHEALHKLGEGWTIAKVAVVGALAIGGTVALVAAVNSLRTKSDPTTPYLRMLKR